MKNATLSDLRAALKSLPRAKTPDAVTLGQIWSTPAKGVVVVVLESLGDDLYTVAPLLSARLAGRNDYIILPEEVGEVAISFELMITVPRSSLLRYRGSFPLTESRLLGGYWEMWNEGDFKPSSCTWGTGWGDPQGKEHDRLAALLEEIQAGAEDVPDWEPMD